jgi:hypothetical protein
MADNDELIHTLAELDRTKRQSRKHEYRSKETNDVLAQVRELLLKDYPTAALARIDALYALRADRRRAATERSAQ